jgi:phycocyanin beta chain
MFDAFTRVVSQADARGDYLSNDQIDGLAGMVKDGAKRLDAVNRITGSASAIVANAARALFAEQPQLIQPGGNAYTNRRMAACLRDMESFYAMSPTLYLQVMLVYSKIVA